MGLDVLARRTMEYRGTKLLEFDLEGALAARPQLILVDELAHTNAPGVTHTKRWQDVERLLQAGIDVYTTLNVQHLESLNDVIAADHGRDRSRDGARRNFRPVGRSRAGRSCRPMT